MALAREHMPRASLARPTTARWTQPSCPLSTNHAVIRVSIPLPRALALFSHSLRSRSRSLSVVPLPLPSLCPCTRHARAIALAAGSWAKEPICTAHVADAAVPPFRSAAPSPQGRATAARPSLKCAAASPMTDPHLSFPSPRTDH
jgi:hypothetical protein